MKFTTQLLTFALALALLPSCETVEGGFSQLKAHAGEATGFDADAPVEVKIGSYTVIAFRVLGLPIGPGLVWLGKVEPLDVPPETVLSELPPIIEVTK